MNQKKLNFLILVVSVILIFIIGVRYELDYRNLTRNTVKYFANYSIEYYRGKEFRIFPIEIALNLTLIPTGYYLLTKTLNSLKTKLILALVMATSLAGFYCLFCYIESEFIRMTVTRPTYENGALLYHFNNVNYKGILFATIVSSFVVGLVAKKLIKK